MLIEGQMKSRPSGVGCVMKLIPLKYNGACRNCRIDIPAGESAWWGKDEGIQCEACHDPEGALATEESEPEPLEDTNVPRTSPFGLDDPVVTDDADQGPQSGSSTAMSPRPIPLYLGDLAGQRTSTKDMRHMPTRPRRTIDPLTLSAGDYMVHEHHGVGRYVEIVQRTVGGATREYIVIEYAPSKRGQPGDRVYVPTDQLDLVSRYEDGRLMRLITLKQSGFCGYCEEPLNEGTTAWWIKGEPLVCDDCTKPRPDYSELGPAAETLADRYYRMVQHCNLKLRKASCVGHEDPYYRYIWAFVQGEEVLLEVAENPQTPLDILWMLAIRPDMTTRLESREMEVPAQWSCWFRPEILEHPAFTTGPTVFFMRVVNNPAIDDALCMRLIDWAKDQPHAADFLSLMVESDSVSEDARIVAALLKPGG